VKFEVYLLCHGSQWQGMGTEDWFWCVVCLC